ncbi:MAG: methyl-accepting chemotaxis protein [Bdellovibrionales bacterium]|nr:methyl-accepting chemotaxis protein [Bdellovibrionales bacterium]
MSLNKKRKFNKLLINPGFQLRYVFWLTASGFVLVAINALIAFSFIRENYITLVELSPMTDETKALMHTELQNLILGLSVTSLCFLGLITFLGLVLSHRTAGPLYHLNRVFNEIQAGNRKARAKFRQQDEFQEVAQSFNKMMDSISAGNK